MILGCGFTLFTMEVEDTKQNINFFLIQLCQYLEATNLSRCIREGEQILKCGNLSLCGRVSDSKRTNRGTNEDEIAIYALYVQTSGVLQNPHKIESTCKVDNNKAVIK